MSSDTPSAAAKKLTLDDVRHVAMLSRLALDEEHLKRLTGQLESILGYIAKLSEVDTTGVEPAARAAPGERLSRGRGRTEPAAGKGSAKRAAVGWGVFHGAESDRRR